MDEDDPTSLRGALLPLAAMTVFQVVISMSALAVPVLAVPLAADLGISPALVGLYMSAVFAAAMVSAVMGASVVVRFGAVRVAQACLVLAGTGMILVCLGHIAAALVASVVLGLAYGPPTPASSHVLARATPARWRPLVFSVKQTGVPAGGALAGAVLPPLVVAFGWRWAVLATVGLCALAVIGLQAVRAPLELDRDPTAPLRGNWLAPLRLVLGHPRLRIMGLLSFSYSAVQMALMAYLVTYLVTEVGLDLVTAGAVLAAAQIAGMAGRILWGLASGTVMSARGLLIVLGLAMAASSLTVAAFTPAWPLTAIVATAVMFGATAIAWNGVYLAELARIAPPGQVGIVTGGCVAVTFAGVVVAPALFSVVAASGLGLAAGFVMLAGFALAGAAVIARMPA